MLCAQQLISPARSQCYSLGLRFHSARDESELLSLLGNRLGDFLLDQMNSNRRTKNVRNTWLSEVSKCEGMQLMERPTFPSVCWIDSGSARLMHKVNFVFALYSNVHQNGCYDRGGASLEARLFCRITATQ